MANKRWLGRASAVAQVDTVTIAGTWEAALDVITLTINAKDLVVTIGSLVTTAEIATTIQQAWENSDFADTTATKIPADGGQDFAEHAEITATVSGSVVTLTHDTDGTPFTLSVTVTDANVAADPPTATLLSDGTGASTLADGPNFYSNADNWDPTNVPVAADDVFIDNSAVSILFGLSQSAVALTSFTVARNFTGDIGLPKQNAAGYAEYRDDYLAVDATAINIGRGEGSGSGRIKLDSGSTQTAITIENTGSSAEFGIEALLWKGTQASNTLDVLDGSVGVAPFGGEIATLLTLRETAGTVRCGLGTTLATVSNQSGNLTVHSNIDTSLTNAAGTVLVGGSATVAILNANGGTVDYQSSGLIGVANIGGPSGATLDFSGRNVARTITTCNLNSGGQIIDPLRTGTYTVVIGSDVESIEAR